MAPTRPAKFNKKTRKGPEFPPMNPGKGKKGKRKRKGY